MVVYDAYALQTELSFSLLFPNLITAQEAKEQKNGKNITK